MFCHSCGNQIADGSKFCDKCGTALQSNSVPTSAPKPNPFGETGQNSFAMSNAYELDSTIKYVCAALMLLSLIFIGGNIGGYLSGLRLIESLFEASMKYMDGSEQVACVLLLISHLGVFIFGIVGLLIFLRGTCATISSLGVMISGLLGVVSGMIAGWNVVAEIVPFVSGIILFYLCKQNICKQNEAAESFLS
jgi:hypothetical protein